MKNIILLHGALGSAAQLAPLAASLNKDFVVHNLDLPGHGGQPMPIDFSITSLAQFVIDYIDHNQIQEPIIFGYSMGGYIAMYLAKNYPGKIKKVVTLATKYHWTETIAQNELKMLDPGQTAAKVPAFADTLEKRHAPNDWKLVMQKTAGMIAGLGKNNILSATAYPSITTPCLILLGDRDKMVTLEETVDTYRSLPNAQMAVLPNAGHPIEKTDVSLLTFLIGNFAVING